MPAPPELDEIRPLKPLEVEVTGSFEEVLRIFKSKVQKSKILSEYKARQAFEKPSEKRRRKKRESEERRRIANLKNESFGDDLDRSEKKNQRKKRKKEDWLDE